MKWLAARVAVLVVAIVVGLGLVEVLGRWFLAPALARYSDHRALTLQLANPRDLGVASLYVPHHYYLYGARPAYRSEDGRVRHNALGCRADDVPVARAPGVVRVVAVGGSTTYASLVRDNARIYTARLEALLNEWARARGLGTSFQVINCGLPGATSAENLARYPFALSEYRADVLLVQQGINDTLPRSLPKISRDYREYSKAWEDPGPVKHRWFVSRLARAAREKFGDSIWTQGINFLVRRPFWDPAQTGADDANYARNGPEIFEANTRYLVRLAAGDGAAVVLLTEHLVVDRSLPWTALPHGRGRATLEHNERLQRIAEAERALYLDVQAALCACRERMPDGRHLNEEGQREKARVIFDYLTRPHVVERWLPARRSAS